MNNHRTSRGVNVWTGLAIILGGLVLVHFGVYIEDTNANTFVYKTLVEFAFLVLGFAVIIAGVVKILSGFMKIGR